MNGPCQDSRISMYCRYLFWLGREYFEYKITPLDPPLSMRFRFCPFLLPPMKCIPPVPPGEPISTVNLCRMIFHSLFPVIDPSTKVSLVWDFVPHKSDEFLVPYRSSSYTEISELFLTVTVLYLVPLLTLGLVRVETLENETHKILWWAPSRGSVSDYWKVGHKLTLWLIVIDVSSK